jgi:hypothetical protein
MRGSARWVTADAPRIAAEAAIADHRAIRIAVDVQHGREVEVEAERAQLAAEHARRALGQLRVVDRPERAHRRQLEQRRSEPLHAPPLLIDRDPGWRLGRAGARQLARELRDLGQIAQIAPEEHEPAQLAALRGRKQLGRRLPPRKTGAQSLTCQLADGFGYHVGSPWICRSSGRGPLPSVHPRRRLAARPAIPPPPRTDPAASR